MRRPLDWMALALALALLNASLTFENVWPTLGIHLTGDLSVEVATLVLALAAAWEWRGLPTRWVRRGLAAFWCLLVAGRYVDVTVPSLYGRDVNIYWDMRFVPDVGAMFAFVATPWLIAIVVAGFIVVPVAIYAPFRWAIGQVSEAVDDWRARRVMGATAGVILLLWIAPTTHLPRPDGISFADPVTAAYAREAGELAYEMSGAGVRALGPAPVIESSFARVEGADVLLMFLESYGATSWDRPEIAEPLAGVRAHLETDIRDTGRSVVSAFVESTTFGGESWLAHISLMSGTEVRDHGTNVRLMGQQRDTLVKAFMRHGYRTIALMPGLLRSWPEGAFYGFSEIYDHTRIGYEGPPFGWWDVNDQFALATLDAREIAPEARPPVFVFFPTITTHAPFTPVPPYQPDWERVLRSDPYDAPALDLAWSEQPDWTNLTPGYVEGLSYAYQTLGGYLRLRAGRDLVVILVGDHQPPALVSGEGASWEVPVHIIASRDALLDRLRHHHRFVDGLAPRRPLVARMDTLLPILLDAFGGEEAGGPDAPGPASQQ